MASHLGSGQVRSSLYWGRPAWVRNSGSWHGDRSIQTWQGIRLGPGPLLLFSPFLFLSLPLYPRSWGESFLSGRNWACGGREKGAGWKGWGVIRECGLAGPWGLEGLYLVRAMTLFFLGCWLTGLPMLPFFREPFRASSRCFSVGEQGKEVMSCSQGHPALPFRAAWVGPPLGNPMLL